MSQARWIRFKLMCVAVMLGVQALLALFCLGGYLVLNDTSKYKNYGRDYVTHFGEGRYVILRSPDGSRSLIDRDTGENLLANVADWKEDGGFVYIGSKDRNYIVLRPDTGEYHRYNIVEDVPQAHRDNVRKLRIGVK